MLPATLITNAGVHIHADTKLAAPSAWRMRAHTGFAIGEDSELEVWIDWEAIPRLCHLLTELYAHRPDAPQRTLATDLAEDR